MDFINKFWEAFKRDRVTSICGLVFAVAYYISSEPNSVAFLGPDIANFMVGLAGFLKGLSVAVGLLFAAQTRPDSLAQKDVIKEVLTENQPEGKKELMSDESDVNQKKIN
jgi:hypothetical protein